MSQLKNDPTGTKQKLVFVVLTIAGAAILGLSGTASRLACSADGACTVVRRSPWSQSKDRFEWGRVTAVRFSQPSAYSVGVGGGSRKRGVSGVNLAVELEPPHQIQLMSRPVAWPIGPLNRNDLQQYVGKAPPMGKPWAVSLGGAQWPISFVFGSVGLLMLLLAFIRPIRSDMSADELGRARAHNLFVFAIVVLGGTVLWIGILGGIVFALVPAL